MTGVEPGRAGCDQHRIVGPGGCGIDQVLGVEVAGFGAQGRADEGKFLRTTVVEGQDEVYIIGGDLKVNFCSCFVKKLVFKVSTVLIGTSRMSTDTGFLTIAGLD